MKINLKYLKKIIKEEVQAATSGGPPGKEPGQPPNANLPYGIQQCPKDVVETIKLINNVNQNEFITNVTTDLNNAVSKKESDGSPWTFPVIRKMNNEILYRAINFFSLYSLSPQCLTVTGISADQITRKKAELINLFKTVAGNIKTRMPAIDRRQGDIISTFYHNVLAATENINKKFGDSLTPTYAVDQNGRSETTKPQIRGSYDTYGKQR